jgi:hypothetical protein
MSQKFVQTVILIITVAFIFIFIVIKIIIFCYIISHHIIIVNSYLILIFIVGVIHFIQVYVNSMFFCKSVAIRVIDL